MSVVGIDLGNINSVIAVARNRGIDVICNEVSNRATPSLVSFASKQRYLGESAKTQEVSNFKNTVGSLKRLLGRSLSEPEISQEANHLNCELVTIGDELGARVMFQDKEQEFTITQLMAMYLTKLKEITERELNRDVGDVVLSVPAYYTDKQRRALINAAEIAGLNVLRLINDVSAAALQWGITKSDLPEADQGVKYVAFVDVGQSDTSVEIIAFQKGKMAVKAIACERNLGGRDFDQALLDHFVTEFKTKYKMDVTSNKKALFRLRLACERAKKVLSANAQAPLNIECLMDDKDVSSMVHREEYVQWVQPLVERLEAPLKRALEIAGISKQDIEVVEVVGGSTRIPAIKLKIQEFFGKELSTTLNQDECVAKGCAFMCAILSPVFKTREFKVEDLSPFPIKLTYEDPSKKEQHDMVAFASYTPIPCTKLLTFYRRDSFDLEASYSDDSVLPPQSSMWLGKFSVSGIQPKGDEQCTVKVKVRLNPNCILEVGSAQVHEEVESSPAADEKENDKMETEDKDSAMDVEPVVEKSKKKIVKKDLVVSGASSAIPAGQLMKLRELECEMIANDKLVFDTAERRNALEEYVYEMRSKLDGAYGDFAPADVKGKLMTMLGETEEWLYGEGEDATKSVYASKLEELHKLGKPITMRFREAEDRPAAIAALMSSLAEIESLATSKDEKLSHIPEDELQKVVKLVGEKRVWLDKLVKKQDTLPKHADPALLVEDLVKERDALARSANAVLNRPKPAAPKVEKKEEPEIQKEAVVEEPVEMSE